MKKRYLWTALAFVAILAAGCAAFKLTQGKVTYSNGDRSIELSVDSIHALGK